MSAPQRLNVAPNPSNASAGVTFQAGMMMMWGGATAPDDWLLCEGQEVSRTNYADLFEAIGTTFGAGDAGAVAFTQSESPPSGSGFQPYQVQFTLPSVASPGAFAVGKQFTVFGGRTGFDTCIWTVTQYTTSYINATATQGGSPVFWNFGVDIVAGTMTPLSPSTFNLPNTQARTIRGVGTEFISIALGQYGGEDTSLVTIAAENLPQHQHGVLVPGNGMFGGSSAGGYPNVDNGTNTIQGTTRLEDGTTLCANSPISVSLTNTFVGLNYIIKT